MGIDTNIVYDSSANQAHGTIQGATWDASQGGLAFHENGGVSCGTKASLHGPTSFSICVLVKVPNKEVDGILVEQRGSKEGCKGEYILSIDDGKPSFLVYGDNKLQFDFSAGMNINDDVWHLIVAVRDGIEGRIYVDGVLGALARGEKSYSLDATNPVFIGYDARDTSHFLTGVIRNLRIFSRALSLGEIALLCKAPDTAALESPVSWWKMDPAIRGYEGEATETTNIKLPESLDPWWKMNATALLKDSEAQGIKGPTWDSREGCMSFDGTGGLACGTKPSLDGTSPFSVCAWIKTPPGAHSNTPGTIIQQKGPDSGYLLYLWQGKPGFAIYGGGGKYQFGISGDTLVSDGKWHLVTAYRDGADGKLYVDGKPASSTKSEAAVSLKPDVPVYIGFDGIDNKDYFTGSIYDVQIYQQPLQDSQVSSLGTSLKNPEAPNASVPGDVAATGNVKALVPAQDKTPDLTQAGESQQLPSDLSTPIEAPQETPGHGIAVSTPALTQAPQHGYFTTPTLTQPIKSSPLGTTDSQVSSQTPLGTAGSQVSGQTAPVQPFGTTGSQVSGQTVHVGGTPQPFETTGSQVSGQTVPVGGTPQPLGTTGSQVSVQIGGTPQPTGSQISGQTAHVGGTPQPLGTTDSQVSGQTAHVGGTPPPFGTTGSQVPSQTAPVGGTSKPFGTTGSQVSGQTVPVGGTPQPFGTTGSQVSGQKAPVQPLGTAGSQVSGQTAPVQPFETTGSQVPSQTAPVGGTSQPGQTAPVGGTPQPLGTTDSQVSGQTAHVGGTPPPFGTTGSQVSDQTAPLGGTPQPPVVDNSTLKDYSKSGAHATVNKASWDPSEGALYFNNDGGITCGTKASLDGTDSFSISVQLKVPQYEHGGTIIQQRGQGNAQGGEYVLSVDNDRPSFLVYGDNKKQFDFSAGTPINDEKWHLIIAVRDGIQGRLYIDGVIGAVARGEKAAPLKGNIPVFIGYDGRDDSNFFAGYIRDVQIYPRALNTDEIEFLNKNTVPATSVESPVAWWKMGVTDEVHLPEAMEKTPTITAAGEVHLTEASAAPTLIAAQQVSALPTSQAVVKPIGQVYHSGVAMADVPSALAHSATSPSHPTNGIVQANGMAQVPSTHAKQQSAGPWWQMDPATILKDSEPLGTSGTVWSEEDGSLSFNGNSGLSCGTKASLDGEIPFSIAAWVKVPRGAHRYDQAIIIQQRGPGDKGYDGEYMLYVKNGRPGFLLYGGGKYQFDFSAEKAINDGKWHLVIALRNGREGHLYVDGDLVASAVGDSICPLKNHIPVFIGFDGRENDDFFTGFIRNLQIFKRALTPQELAVVSKTLALAESLGCWWKLNPSVLYDSEAAGLKGPTWDPKEGSLLFNGNVGLFSGTKASLDGTTPFTVAAWIKVPRGAHRYSHGVIIQQRGAEGCDGGYVVSLKNGIPGFLVYGNEKYQFNFSANTAINDGKWHVLIAVRDGLKGRLYVDKTLVGSAEGDAISQLNANISTYIGFDGGENGGFFNGFVRDVQIYTKALDTDAISLLNKIYTSIEPSYGLPSKEDIGVDGGVSFVSSIGVLDFDSNLESGLSTKRIGLGGNIKVRDQAEAGVGSGTRVDGGVDLGSGNAKAGDGAGIGSNINAGTHGVGARGGTGSEGLGGGVDLGGLTLGKAGAGTAGVDAAINLGNGNVQAGVGGLQDGAAMLGAKVGIGGEPGLQVGSGGIGAGIGGGINLGAKSAGAGVGIGINVGSNGVGVGIDGGLKSGVGFGVDGSDKDSGAGNVSTGVGGGIKVGTQLGGGVGIGGGAKVGVGKFNAGVGMQANGSGVGIGGGTKVGVGNVNAGVGGGAKVGVQPGGGIGIGSGAKVGVGNINAGIGGGAKAGVQPGGGVGIGGGAKAGVGNLGAGAGAGLSVGSKGVQAGGELKLGDSKISTNVGIGKDGIGFNVGVPLLGNIGFNLGK